MWKALSGIIVVVSLMFLFVFLFGSRVAKVLQWVVAFFIVAALALAFKPLKS